MQGVSTMIGNKELECVLIVSNDDESPGQSFRDSKCNCNFMELLSSVKNGLPLFSDGYCLIYHHRPESFWMLLSK